MKKNRMIIMIFLVLGIILNENIVTFAKDDETNVRYVKYSIKIMKIYQIIILYRQKII